MTILELLLAISFTIPPVMAILSAGRSAGAVGFIVGLLVGLGTGGLGSYTLKLTADYTLRSYERRKPGIVRGMIDLAILICFGIVTLTASGLAVFITKFFIRYAAP